jgi:hypothetical protein
MRLTANYREKDSRGGSQLPTEGVAQIRALVPTSEWKRQLPCCPADVQGRKRERRNAEAVIDGREERQRMKRTNRDSTGANIAKRRCVAHTQCSCRPANGRGNCHVARSRFKAESANAER